MSVTLISYETCHRLLGDNGFAKRAIVTVQDDDIDTRIIRVLAAHHMTSEDSITVIATLYCREDTVYTIA